MADGGDLPGGGNAECPNVCSIVASLLSQRSAVQNLINWLRESQTTCTDSNCFEDVRGIPGTEFGAPVDSSDLTNHIAESDSFFMMLWIFIGILTVYVINLTRARQNNQRTREKSKNGPEDDRTKFRRDHYDDNNGPAT